MGNHNLHCESRSAPVNAYVNIADGALYVPLKKTVTSVLSVSMLKKKKKNRVEITTKKQSLSFASFIVSI